MKKLLSLILVCLLLSTSCFAVFSANSGDVNFDDKISIIDVAKERAKIIGTIDFTAEELLAGDANRDGKISIIDIVMLRAAIVNNCGEIYHWDTETETETDEPVVTDTETETETDEPVVTDTETETETDEPVVTDTETETETDEPVVTDTETEIETDEPVVTDIETETETDEPVVTDTETETETDEPVVTDTETETDEPAVTDTEIDTEIKKFERLYFYRNKLSGVMLENYNKICDGIEKVEQEINITPIPEEDFLKVYVYVILDHPEYYFLSLSCSYAVDNSNNAVRIVNLYRDEFDTAEEIKSGFDYIDSRLQPIIDEANKKATTYEKILYVYDAVKNLYVYEVSEDSFDIYGALTGGKSVCEGYSETFQYILTKMEITSILVNGEIISTDGTPNVPHRWNMLNIDGDWYHFDVTWDDNYNDRTLEYSYFGLTTEEILNSRLLEDEIPLATKTDYNFYSKNNLVVSSLNYAELKAASDISIKMAENSIAFKFTERELYNEFIQDKDLWLKLIREYVRGSISYTAKFYTDLNIVELTWKVK